MSDASPNRKRRSSERISPENQTVPSRKRPRSRPVAESMIASTPNPEKTVRSRGPMIPRISDLRAADQSILNTTQGVSFSGQQNGEHSEFDQVYDSLGTLGEGSFSFVHKCRHKVSNHLHAVKVLKKDFESVQKRVLMVNEVKHLEKIPPHPNIVGFVRAWQQHQQLHIVTELCQGDLLHFLKKLVKESKIAEDPYMQPEKVPEELCWNVMTDMLRAASHLHANKVVHLDIKPDNIFMGLEDGRFKLGDFGTAWNFAEDSGRMAQEGDGRYAANETYYNIFTPKADTFSIGVTILQLALGITNPRHPRYQDQWSDLKANPDEWEGKYPEEMKGKSQELWEMIRLMLTFDHERRPSPAELIQLPGISARIVEREKHLLRSRIKFRFHAMFHNLFQLLTFICPRQLISKLRPYVTGDSPSTPDRPVSISAMPETPKVNYSLHRSSDSFRTHSTPSRVEQNYDMTSSSSEGEPSGRCNLSKVWDTDGPNDFDEEIDDNQDEAAMFPRNLSPIRRAPKSP